MGESGVESIKSILVDSTKLDSIKEECRAGLLSTAPPHYVLRREKFARALDSKSGKSLIAFFA